MGGVSSAGRIVTHMRSPTPSLSSPRLASLVRSALLAESHGVPEGAQIETDRRIFMHLAGPPGSGKTTLLRMIEAKFPDQAACVDLDDFDEAATDEMGLPSGYGGTMHWKTSEEVWEEHGREHFRLKQGMMDRFITEHPGQLIIFGGIHAERDYELEFYPEHRVLMGTSPRESMRRRIARDRATGGSWEFWRDQDFMRSEMQGSERIVRDLLQEGYRPMSPQAVIALVQRSIS